MTDPVTPLLCPKRPGQECETPLSCAGRCKYNSDPIHPNREQPMTPREPTPQARSLALWIRDRIRYSSADIKDDALAIDRLAEQRVAAARADFEDASDQADGLALQLRAAQKVIEAARRLLTPRKTERPTLAELEAILEQPETKVRIAPDGQVYTMAPLDDLEEALAAYDEERGDPT